jgi:hypothetical protein
MLPRGSPLGHSGELPAASHWPLERPDGIPTLERGNENEKIIRVFFIRVHSRSFAD